MVSNPRFVSRAFFGLSTLLLLASPILASEPSHEVAIFLGLTSEEHHDDEETIGLDYEYRLGDRFGLGGLVDYAGGELDTTVAAISVTAHPTEALYLLVAPSYEFHGGDSEFLVRAGAGYHFRAGGVSIGPMVAIDFVDGEEITVFGITIGKEF